jgi:CheY-like chemotaxis protein
MDLSSPDLKILVADDSPVYRNLVEHTLAQEQYAVLIAKNGRQALDLFAKHQPALAGCGKTLIRVAWDANETAKWGQARLAI